MYPKEYCLTDYHIMKDLGMDPSRNSTHYLITMTTFTHHSLAETWNFVASVTGTQVFSCATNFKLFVKSTVKEEKEKHVPQHSLHRGSCVGTKLPFCLPLQSSVPPRREGLTFRALSFLQCCSHRGSSARKAISCKNSGQRRNKTKTSTCAQPYSPGPWFPSKLWPTKWRRLGTMLRKAPFPKENLLSHFRVCNPQGLQLFLILPLWEAAQHLQPALGTGRKLLKGGAPTFAELWTTRIKSWVELQGSWDHPDYKQSAGMNIPVLSQDGQSLLERDSVYLQQSTGCAEIVKEKYYAVFWVLNLFLHVL